MKVGLRFAVCAATLAGLGFGSFAPAVAVVSAQAAEDPLVAAVRRARATFNRAIARRDPNTIGRLLAPMYRVVTGRGDYLDGGEQEARRWRGRFGGDRRLRHSRDPTEITVNAEWGIAHEAGTWTARNSSSGRPIVSSGVYAARWQQAENGRWIIQAEILTTLKCDGPEAGCFGPEPIFK